MLYLIGCIVLWAGSNVFNKIASSKINPYYMQIVFAVFAMCLIPLYHFLTTKMGFNHKWDKEGIIYSALGALCSIFGTVCLYTYVSRGNGIGVALCFVSLYPVVALILSTIFLNEKISLYQGVLIVIMMICAVLLGLKK